MAELPVANDLIAPTITEEQFKAALKLLVDNVASKDWVNLNPLFKPATVVINTNVDDLPLGIHIIETSAVANTLIGMPAGATLPVIGFIIVYRKGGAAYQRFIRYASTIVEQWERTGNGGTSSFAWNIWAKMLNSADIEKAKTDAINAAAAATIATGTQLNNALANANLRPNLFTDAQINMISLPTTSHVSTISKVTAFGKPAVSVTANAAGAYPTNAGALWIFTKTAADFPSGFLSAQITIDALNAGTGGYISIIQYDGGGATLSNDYLTPISVTDAITESTTYYVTGVAVKPTTASIRFYMRMDGTGRSFTVSRPMLCDGKSAYWRNPTAAITTALTLNLFPNTALTSSASTMYQATNAVESGYDTATMTPGIVSQLFYEIPIAGLWRVGDTLTLATDVFTDVANGSGSSSADIGIVFLDNAGATIGTISAANSGAANSWNTISTSRTVPANTAKIRFRFVHRNIGQVSKFRRPVLTTSNPDALTLTSSTFGATSSGGTAATPTIFVSPAGNDSNSGMTAGSAVATFAKALALVGNSGTIELLDGEYRQTLLSLATGHIRIRSARNQRARVFGSDQLVVSKTSGFTQVYQAPLAAKPTGMTEPRLTPAIFEWNTPSKAIAMDDRHFLQRGRTHRLPFTAMYEAASKADLDTAAGRGKWFWESGIIYFAATDGGDATAKRYEARVRNCITHANGSIELERVDCYFSLTYGLDLNGTSTRRSDCRVFGAGHNGFSDNANFTVSYRDEAGGNSNDGFNGTVNNYSGYADEATRIEAAYFDPYSHDNGDDGISYHIRGDVSIYGGAFEYNTKADVVHVTGAACSCYNTLAQGTKYGFYTATAPLDTRTHTSMRCVNTRARKNEICYIAGTGSQLDCENAVAENPITWGYYTDTTSGSIINARNCRYTGDGAKMKSGNVVVTNDGLLT